MIATAIPLRAARAARIHDQPLRRSEPVAQADRCFEQRVIAIEGLVRACITRQRGPCAGQVVVVHTHINVGPLAEQLVQHPVNKLNI